MSPFHDSRLFGGNQFHAIAEISLVIKRDWHDDGNRRVIDDIGRIETAAQANLNDRGIGGLFRKSTNIAAVRISKTVIV